MLSDGRFCTEIITWDLGTSLGAGELRGPRRGTLVSGPLRRRRAFTRPVCLSVVKAAGQREGRTGRQQTGQLTADS